MSWQGEKKKVSPAGQKNGDNLKVTLKNKTEMARVPYIGNFPSDGRVILEAPYYDYEENQFYLFIPGNPSKGIFATPKESFYFAKKIDDDKIDLDLKIIRILSNHYSYKEVMIPYYFLQQDILNCGTILEKYFIFLDHFKKSQDINAASLIRTELEYLFYNYRSFCDILQEIISAIHVRYKKVELNKSFNHYCGVDLQKNIEKVAFSKEMKEFYNKWTTSFILMRNIRDKISHHGKTIYHIYCNEDGFGIGEEVKDLRSFYSSKYPKPNDIVSLLPIISKIIKNMIDMSNDLTDAIVSTYEKNPSIYGEYTVYLRGDFSNHINLLDTYMDKEWVTQKSNQV